MSPLSDDYLRSLEPETMRYDVTIFDDFVLSVLPNGLKTWAFLYEHDGRTRRKTLGVYPDMSYEQAEDALDDARALILKLGDDVKDSAVEPDTPRVEIPPEAIVATPPPAPTPELTPTMTAQPAPRPAVLATRKRKRYGSSNWQPQLRSSRKFLKWSGVALGGVLALGLVVFVLPRLGLFNRGADAAPATERDRTGRDAPKPIVINEAPDTVQPDDTMPPVDAVQPADDQTSDTRDTVTPSDADALLAQIGAASDDASRALDDKIDEAAADTSVAIAPSAPTPAPEPEPEPQLIADVATPAADPPPAIAPPPEPVQVATADTSPDPAPPATDEPVATSQPDPVSSAATAGGGKVSRAMVTSGVENLEPVDDLGESIALGDGGFRTVFYFTELRNFTAGQVMHRWTYNGRVIADVPLKVGGGWRWRTYSSKDLLPGMIGDWEVAVIDADGRTLGSRRFRFDR